MTALRASIVVPSRGGATRLPHLIDALRAQTETSWEAIVVIDGDIDGSAAVVDLAGEDLPVRTVILPENQGRSAALNAGFDMADGDVLIRCDDDLCPAPGFVAAHVARHTGNPCGVVGLYRNEFPPTPYARAYGQQRDEQFRREAYAAPESRRWRYWAGNVSVTRETFDRVGAYDTAFRTYGWEDVDWGYRLQAAGVPVVLAPELETVHQVAATTTEIRVRRAFYAGAARRVFETKHGVGALGAAMPPRGVWGRLVERTAARQGLADLHVRAQRADRALDRMPRWAAEKRVAWLVEAAGLSGQRRPDEVGTDV
ncbi:glycosyltransferase family 2 protein [uncultured Microbacterium sp.]|uniref:glycosyltransferase family 2 protein n=1 Tax=uncultured Microbacterium sp. TaxID=191216 RepID=UPI00261674BC|nr:glycosyltransferase family A protein [uncultured Microbacterium sp.]